MVLFIILYNILYNIYNLLFIRLAVITQTESLSVTQSLLHTRRVSRITVKTLVKSNIIQSVYLIGKGRLKERCGLEPRTNFFRLRNRQKLVWIRFENIRYILLKCVFPLLAVCLK